MRGLLKLIGSLVCLGGIFVLVAADTVGGAVIATVGILILVVAFQVPTKKCPFCAEPVKREAKVCRYCGRDFPVPAS